MIDVVAADGALAQSRLTAGGRKHKKTVPERKDNERGALNGVDQ